MKMDSIVSGLQYKMNPSCVNGGTEPDIPEDVPGIKRRRGVWAGNLQVSE